MIKKKIQHFKMLRILLRQTVMLVVRKKETSSRESQHLLHLYSPLIKYSCSADHEKHVNDAFRADGSTKTYILFTVFNFPEVIHYLFFFETEEKRGLPTEEEPRPPPSPRPSPLPRGFSLNRALWMALTSGAGAPPPPPPPLPPPRSRFTFEERRKTPPAELPEE